MSNPVAERGGYIACPECIERFRESNYISEEELMPERHFCMWCAKNKPKLYWFRMENKALADQRREAEQRRQKAQLAAIRGKDTRAHYKEKFWEEEVS